MMGGHSAYKQPTEEEREFFIAQRETVQQHAGGNHFEQFEVVHFTSQVVAGLIYQVKYSVGGGDHVHAKIFKPLPHTGQPA